MEVSPYLTTYVGYELFLFLWLHMLGWLASALSGVLTTECRDSGMHCYT